MSTSLLNKGYEPHDVEKRWYELWEKEKLFEAEAQSPRQSFSIVIPPPNVTGVLHMGHALNNTLQDILCRYRRLRGDNVLWMPGTDHAGIATQNVVEKALAKEGRTRHQLGRAEFVDEVWKWREKYGSAIIGQLKRMGASCDWKRERFTMDEGLSRAVRKVFVDLYNQGLIYRGNYIINWCPRCHTALADLEVEHEELEGNLYHIRYPFPDKVTEGKATKPVEGKVAEPVENKVTEPAEGKLVESADGIVVATTRPETMLGDTAVAVNPDDERYKDTGPGEVILPLMNRKIPVIRDKYVDMSFGTGGLKVTPAHDPNDFEIGQRHHLPIIKVIGDDGIMTAEAGRFEGLDRLECRKAVVAELKKEGLLEKIKPYPHNVGHCYRCQTVIEPNLSKQWFVSAKPLAEKAMAAVRNGQTRIIPEIWNKTYFDWLENIRDWCISRQIWWGHQIPAWTCQRCEKLTVAENTPDRCPECGGNRLTQESDVLDTWFSSALWPFSTMGWPDETHLLKTFYPTSVLVTAFDILFFWVARMMMMGTQFMGEVPFREVYVHALVLDEDGRKMSKSVGNVIDPLTVIDTYGTDAFRFTLAAFAAQGRHIRMSEKRVEGYRHFINKLWNAARFALMNMDGSDFLCEIGGNPEHIRDTLSLPDRWILSRLNTVTETVAGALDTYRFNDAAAAAYKFVWHEFCDWYLEAIKPVLYSDPVKPENDEEKNSTRRVLWQVLRDTLILLHPFIPFVTEEIWHKLPGTEGSVMKAVFPLDNPGSENLMVSDPDAESEMELVTEVITCIRNIRGEMNIPPSLPLDAVLQSEDEETGKTIRQHRNMIITLARLRSLSTNAPGERPESSATGIAGNATIFVPLKGIIDFAREIERLEKEIAKLSKELETASKKLSNEDFLAKAPEEVIQKAREKQELLFDKKQKLGSNLDKIREMTTPED